MSWKAVIAFLVALGIGGAIMFVGVRGLVSAEPSCGGQAMSRGDTCRETRNGTTTERTFDEQKGQNQQGNYIGIGFGAVIAAGAIFFAVAGARNRRALRAKGEAGPAPIQ